MLNDHGLGDTIQFFRYLPLMAAAGVDATFVCPPRLRRLLSSKAKVRFADSPPDGEPFDAQIAISSLPRAFGTRLDTIPAAVPYLAAEPALRDMWLKRIGAEGFKIGVVWQGNPDPEADRARSMPLTALAPLAEIAGVRLISLQKGAGEEQLSSLPPSMRVETLGADFDAGADAFVDTAAAMTCLDLIVTCDTSIAHLAGALAVPVWVALKSDAEWRWLTGRADSPWYPTMRLFRQTRRGVWSDVFEAMARELAELAERRAAPRMVSTPCSLGELIDKITILRIKAERIGEPEKLANVHRELTLLERLAREDGASGTTIDLLTDQLAAVNARLWTIEDALRACEREGDFGPRFVALARSVYCENDTRAAIKRAINTLASSALGRGEELRVNRLSPESRSSAPSARTVAGRIASAGAAAVQPDSDCRPAPPDHFRLAHFGCLVDMHRQSGGSAMSRASARRRPSRDRSQIRPSHSQTEFRLHRQELTCDQPRFVQPTRSRER